MLPHNALLSPCQPILRQLADDFKERRSHRIVQIFGRQFLLPCLAEPLADLRREWTHSRSLHDLRLHGAPLLFALFRYATESCIDILIMWLEPVAERTPQQTRRSTCRATFDDVVLVVKEIRRISLVKRKCSEAGKRSKGSRSPFPPIAEQPVDPEIASVIGVRVDW